MIEATNSIVVALISAAGGILTAYIAVRYKDLLVRRNKQGASKDRMETIFDGYESLIKQQQVDVDRKSRQLDQTQKIIDRLQEELDQTRHIVQQQQVELASSKDANRHLVAQLDMLKQQYGDK